MDFSSEKVGKYYTVAVAGRLDATTAGQFVEQCNDWLDKDETHIVVDMAGIEYISSAGLRAILASAKKLKSKGGEIRFCALAGMVADVFKMSGFTAMFKIFETREQATSG